MLCLSFISILVLATAEHHESNEFVVDHTADSITKSFESGIPVLTMYYAPWCGHCQRTMPQFELACKNINQSDASSLECSRLDCTKNEQFCRDQGLQGYPTIKLVHNDVTCEYKGQRTEEHITKWTLNFYYATTDTSDTETALKRISEGYSIVAYVDQGHSLRDLIKKMSCDFSSVNFIILSDSAIAKALNIEESNSINVFANGTLLKKISNVENSDSIMREIFFSTTPLIPEYAHDSLHLVFNSFVKSYVIFIYDSDESLEKYTSSLKTFAESQIPEVRVFTINGSNVAYKDVVDFFRVTSLPQVIFYNDLTQKYHHLNDQEIKHETLLDFSQGCLNGSVPIYVQRQPVPEGWDKEEVKILVTDTFDKIFETYKSGIILFYAPWCGHCEAFMPTWDKFGQLISSSHPEIFVAKLDHTANDIQGIEIQGYPTVIAFKSRNEQIPYKGERTVESLQKFIEENLISETPSGDEKNEDL